jgi:hypothetical protein
MDFRSSPGENWRALQLVDIGSIEIHLVVARLNLAALLDNP